MIQFRLSRCLRLPRRRVTLKKKTSFYRQFHLLVGKNLTLLRYILQRWLFRVLFPFSRHTRKTYPSFEFASKSNSKYIYFPRKGINAFLQQEVYFHLPAELPNRRFSVLEPFTAIKAVHFRYQLEFLFYKREQEVQIRYGPVRKDDSAVSERMRNPPRAVSSLNEVIAATLYSKIDQSVVF